MEDYNKTPIDPDVEVDSEGNDLLFLGFCDPPYDHVQYGKKSGKFYFMDIDQMVFVGPYDSMKEASEQYDIYWRHLDDKIEEYLNEQDQHNT